MLPDLRSDLLADLDQDGLDAVCCGILGSDLLLVPFLFGEVQLLEVDVVVNAGKVLQGSQQEEFDGFWTQVLGEVFGDPAHALDDQGDGFGGVEGASGVVGQEFEQNIDHVLAIGVLEYPEHDSVDGLDEVVRLVLDVPRPQLLIYL